MSERDYQIYNFSAGPAMLPRPVMEAAQAEFLDWRGSGLSVMEFSHRGKDFMALAHEIEQDFRGLLAIPKNYHVLFLHGGAQTQFSAIPMNLLDNFKSAAYVNTGFWGKKASAEASRYTNVSLIADTESAGFLSVPPQSAWGDFSKDAYLYYVDNETINGVEFPFVPAAGDVPLICDMSSNLLSRPIDVSKYGLIYACAQKNLGMAGIAIVIVRDDLLQRKPLPIIPSILDYRKQIEMHSMFNTPPTFAWYMTGKVFEWIKREGGLSVMEARNREKAKMLYDIIDQSDFYTNKVEKSARSLMNVPFCLPIPDLDARFLIEAEKQGLVGLKGHKLGGGIRASIYNAMPIEGVRLLADFMVDFRSRHN